MRPLNKKLASIGSRIRSLTIGIRITVSLALLISFGSIVVIGAGTPSRPLGIGSASAAPTTAPPATDSCSYPASSFNENTIAHAIEVQGTGTGASINMLSNDETGMLLGVNTSNASSGTNGSVSPDTPGNSTTPFFQDTANPFMGTPNPDPSGRPQYPALFITDLTTNGANSTAGDWQTAPAAPHNVTANTTNGSASFTVITGSVTSADVGATVSDTGGAFSSGDAIASVAGSTVTLVTAASKTVTPDTITITDRRSPANLSGGFPWATEVGGSWSTGVLSSGTYTPTKPSNKNNWDFGPMTSAGSKIPPWRQITDAKVLSTSLSTLTTTSAEFASSDNGMLIDDASFQGGSGKIAQGTTLTYVSPTQVTLSAPASGAVSNDAVEIGTTAAPASTPTTSAEYTSLLGANGNEGFGADVAWDVTDPNHGTLQATDGTGALKAGHTYRVQVITHDGDQNKTGGDAGELCTTFSIPGVPDLVVTKSSSPATTTPLQLGQSITYTLTFDNSSGSGAATVDYTDLLGDVTDDATVTTNPAEASGSGLTVDNTNLGTGSFRITGSIAAGATATVTYTAKVNNPDTGNHVLNNYVVTTGSSQPPNCATNPTSDCTSNPVTDLMVTKSSSPASGSTVELGQPVTYTLTFHNTGAAAASVDSTDTLSDVTDDATVTTPPAEASGTGLTVDNTNLGSGSFRITGSIAAGATATVTYTVTVNSPDKGNHVLNNVVVPTGNTPVCDQASDNCTTNPVADIKIVKGAAPALITAAGQTVTYTFTVTNTGQVPLTGVVVNDTQIAPASATLASGPTCVSLASPSGSCSGSSTSLAIGQVATFTATYTATAADVANGSINDTATATGTPTGGPAITSLPSTASVPTTNLVVTKTSDPASGSTVELGQSVTYTLTFHNNNDGGSQAAAVDYTDTLSGVTDDATVTTNPAEASGSGLTVDNTNLPTSFHITGSVAADSTATVTYTVKVNSPDAGNHVLNNVVVPTGNTPVCDQANDNCTTNPVADIKIVKGAAPALITAAGQTVTYTFTVTNTGQVPLTGVVVNDTQIAPASATLASGPTCVSLASPLANCTSSSSTSLAIGQVATFTATYTATAADVANGSINDTATATGTPTGGPAITSLPSTASVPTTNLSVTKTSNPASGSTVELGQTVTYTLTFHNNNDGGSQAAAVDYTDTLSGVTDDATVTTAPAEASGSGLTVDNSNLPTSFHITGSVAADSTATVTYTVKVNSPDAGNHVLNNVVVPTGNTPVCDQANDNCTTNPVADISILKAAAPALITAAGQTVTYTFTVTNTGQVPLTGVVVNDTQIAPASATLASGPTCVSLASPSGSCSGSSTSLAIGQVATFTATYTATAADVANGSINDTATATGTPTGGPAITSLPSTASVPTTNLVVTKTSDPASGSTVGLGQSVTYTLTFHNNNDGSNAAASVDYTDTLSGVTDDATVTTNPAEASGSGLTVDNTNLPTSFHITGSVAADSTATVTYTVKVNAPDTGNHVLNNVVVPTGNTPVCDQANDNCTTNPVADLVVTKSSSPASTDTVELGQPVTYTLTFHNSGAAAASVDSTDLLGQVLDDATVTTNPAEASGSGLTVDNTNLGSGSFRITGSVAAGATATVTYTVTVNSPDKGDHVLNNYVVPTGSPQPPSCVTNPTSACTTNPVADISILKAASPALITAAGQTVTYTFTVTNTGQTPLTGVVVNDTQIAPASATLASGPTCVSLASPLANCTSSSSTSLAIGQVATFTATYTATAADVANGSINDTATATGTPTGGPAITSLPSTASVPTTNLSVTKTSNPASGSTVELGQTVTYTLTFHNNNDGGSQAAAVDYTDTLSGVTDDATVTTAPAEASGSGLTVDNTNLPTSFHITGSVAADSTATVTYTVKVNSPDAGNHVLNNVVVPTGNTPVCDQASDNCTTNPVADISILKAASPALITAAGQTVTYTFTVTNTGQVPLTGVVVNDTQETPAGALASGPTCVSLASPSGSCSGSSTSLAIGQVATFTATYTSTSNDLSFGSINDSATATGTPTGGPAITSLPSTASVPTTNLVVTKTSDPASGSTVELGQTVTYTLTFHNNNDGSKAAASVDYTDTLSGVTDDATVTTAPAEASGSGLTVDNTNLPTSFHITGSVAADSTATVTYTVKVNSPDAGNHVLNNVVVPTGSNPVCDVASDNCTTNPVADISILKAASPALITAAGQTVTYTFTVTNTGQVPLTGVVVNDTQETPAGALASGPTCVSLASPSGSCSGSSTSLAIGQVATFTATYTSTSNDLSFGSINDSATATGTPTGGPAITSLPSTASVPTTNLEVTKTSNPTSGSTVELGQSVTYTLTFHNNNDGSKAAASVDYTDTLSGVTDDATVTTAPAEASGSGLTVDNTNLPTSFHITGSVAADSTATVTYTVKVNNPDAGNHVLNNVVVPTGNTPVCDQANDNCTTNPVADIKILKGAAPALITAAGQTVTYTFTVTNTGQVPLTGVVVNDTQETPAGALASGPTCVSLASPSGSCSGASTSLAIGQVATFTATYTSTSNDLAHGSINDSATATGTPTGGPAITSPPSTASVPTTNPVVPTPNLVVSKSSNPATTDTVELGQSVTYTLTFQNTGAAAASVDSTDLLSDVTDDATVTTAPAEASGSGLSVDNSNLSSGSFHVTGSVAPDSTATVTYTVKVNNPDTGNHVLDNYVVPTGSPQPPNCATNPTPDCTSNPVADISILKSASIASFSTAGTLVTYSYLVTNTGQATLNPTTVTDPMTGLSSISCPQTSLTPGESETCTATYTTTTADVTQRHIDNTGTATGVPPQGPPVTATSSVSIPFRASAPAPSTTTTTTTVAPTTTTTTTTPVAKPGKLAFTGAQVVALVTTALTLIGLGFALLLIGRGRRRVRRS